MIQNMSLQIVNYKKVLNTSNQIIMLNESHISEQGKKMNALSLQLKISKKLTIIGVPTAIIGGFIGGFILSR
tara:strand:- start:4492 stop:4707 length:216 start_codon:yes stop_codon:yes gene_type:complete